MKYAWIAKNKVAWPVTVTCEVVGVSTSGYFEHQRRRQTSQIKVSVLNPTQLWMPKSAGPTTVTWVQSATKEPGRK